MSDQLNVFMISAEAFPFAKVGGLADVIGALPGELEKLGFSVSVILPRYKTIDLEKFGFKSLPLPSEASVRINEKTMPFDVHSGLMPGTDVRVFLIGNDLYFGRPGIYADPSTGKVYPDEAERWIFFQRAALEFLRVSGITADVFHCHDHQTALIPAYVRRFYGDDPTFRHAATVYTIHNMGYQGIYPREAVNTAGFGIEAFYPLSPFEFFGQMNFMKAGIAYADLITTVSETYASEIQESEEYGYKLEGVLRARTTDVFGILNGIDPKVWSPEKDGLIPAHYSVKNLKGKLTNKKAVLGEFGLDDSKENWPVLAMISRIDVQKGFDLLIAILDELLDSNLFFVLLGTGDKKTESQVQSIAERHKGKAGVRLVFDNRLAHLIEAGADMFLMPSKYEPCGLNQMYSLRYGTIPIVRATGGLADTVKEFDPASDDGTGFSFRQYDAEHFKAAIGRALSLWSDRDSWRRLMKNAMQQDFSWTESAKKYCRLYEAAVAKKRG